MNQIVLHKIISGGQTGADRAGLDEALRLGIPSGGFCPAGRRAEDGPIPQRYPLTETVSPHYAVRTGMNIKASDATLVLNLGILDGGTRTTVACAARQGKPCLIVQLDGCHPSAAQVADWLADNSISTLNIAGPRESKRPGIYRQSMLFLKRLLTLIARRQGKTAFHKYSVLLKEIFPSHLHEQVFLVGGVVRDIMTGRQSRDIDLVAALTEGELHWLGFRLIEGKSTAPIMVRHLPDAGSIEVTVLPTVAHLAVDLAARDFTCNAMALTLDGNLIDPLGGKKDLQTRSLRACSISSFHCDPVRIFRGFRFETDGWQLSRSTEKLIISDIWNDQLAAIPVERFTREMQKALTGREPARFFRRMLEFDVGEIFLPELFRMPLIPAGPLQHHPEGDLFTHCCQVLERAGLASDDPLTRFCAFFHDLGKLATKPAHYPRHHGHEESGEELAGLFCRRLKLPTAWEQALSKVCRLHGTVNRWQELRDGTKIRVAHQAIKAGIVDILPIVAAADKPGGTPRDGWQQAVTAAQLTTAELGIAPLQLEMLEPEKRGEFILQKRIEALRMTQSRASKNRHRHSG